MEIEIIGLKGIPLIKKGDDLSQLIIQAAVLQGIQLSNEDILVIAETAVAKAEGHVIQLEHVEPGEKAKEIAKHTGKDAELVESIIQESNEIIKVGPDFIISETKHGFVCANAGIDESNVDEGLATPIPVNPDISAHEIREKLENNTGKSVAVIISDTQGRAFREGAIGTAIGISGMSPLWDRCGELDLYGRELKTTSIAVADELSSAASLMMGQASEGIPVVIIRGVNYFQKLRNESATIKPLIRPKQFDVFRE
ncbi:MAG: coenzyme F420-0:L-glutamate ligase [Methanobacterium sp.]|jgi:coenzyme F420-0:L-glutamate ligase/coenzyme F420-1:gamma-L-glutamate ligase|uniref:Coenzyme F420:L-glutamate ligase n=1 Tax=Methanobacterium subterraneum TaxID=59277 RepID=A0A2H4VSN9_9EURY|nr:MULTISPECIES: coenzyme F420-0:L-glutamate ligase [Methanobacterium]AUB57990.1 coenzyme F420-0:L-glutamate ligase [Methanobacterium sp. MZ-A1]AUB61121.1 coenzyme F420-0:L-glutamate ligase [Methanobacterium subterraneum]MCC7559990.1 coenzyme F420-0:L-glutamate ligase [Methanobacterium sp.]